MREEEGEYGQGIGVDPGVFRFPDLLKDRAYEPDPELDDTVHEHAEGQREAMALIDDAENLLAVLLAAVEPEGDSRAANHPADRGN